LLSLCSTRAFTSFLISASGMGLSRGKWISVDSDGTTADGRANLVHGAASGFRNGGKVFVDGFRSGGFGRVFGGFFYSAGAFRC